jgi:hypothetical protein
MSNLMHLLGVKYDTDKITYHEYHEIYDFFLKSLYSKKGSILEIGIDSGKSLNMWLELFPNAFIYGMDIGGKCSGARFNVINGDQSNSSDLKRVNDIIKNDNLFFVNDDGSHIPEHQLLTFNTLFPSLCEGGVYIIEDVETSYWTKGNCYNYPTRYGYRHPNSIIEIFKEVADSVNSECAGIRCNRVDHSDSIGSITFARNCIIITKKTRINRPYKFYSSL